jgi:hypothetical protein
LRIGWDLRLAGFIDVDASFIAVTFLAFLTDQIAQEYDQMFQNAIQGFKICRAFWEKVNRESLGLI